MSYKNRLNRLRDASTLLRQGSFLNNILISMFNSYVQDPMFKLYASLYMYVCLYMHKHQGNQLVPRLFQM